MKRSFLWALILVLTSIGYAQAQTKVTGRIADGATGSSLPQATVVVKGTTVGVNADDNGNYSITVPSDATILVFSFVGYADVEEVIGGRSLINVSMKGVQELDDIVVLGYGIKKSPTETGSASLLKTEKLVKGTPISSIDQVLQGSVAGVTVGVSSGQPGAALSVRVRGTGSFNASNAPLYVIDGVPAVSGNISVSGVGNDSKSLGSLIALNPNDVESISILKDAAAASLYGSMGANGVVLITTKKGKSGKPKFTFRGSWGVSDWAVDTRPIVSGDQQHDLTYESMVNYRLGLGDSQDKAKVWADNNINDFAPKRDSYSDWINALFRKGYNHSYEFSAQGGDGVNKFYTSLAYTKDQGMVNNSKMDTYNGRFNYTYKKDKVDLGVSVSISKIDQQVVSEGTAYANPYFATRSYLYPNVPIYNPDGSYYEGSLLNGLANLVKDADLDYNGNAVFQNTNSAWLGYEIINGLVFKQVLSYNFLFNNARTTWPVNSNNGEVHGGLGIDIASQIHTLYSSTGLNYTKTFAKKHNFYFMAVWDVNSEYDKITQAVGKKIPYGMYELANSGEPTTAYSNHDKDRMLSFISKVDYNYDNKYLFGLTYRRDGSSRFGANQRWANFWSVSGAWKVSEEAFMENISFVKDVKVRGSYGVSGTLPSSWHSHLDLYYFGYDYNSLPGSAPGQVPNPDLSWEKNYNLDLGLEARFFDRVSLTFDYYNRDTKDLLLAARISGITGNTSALMNIGEMNNKGIEADINVDIMRTRDFNWTAGLVLSRNVNKIVKLYNGADESDGIFMRSEGKSRYTIWTREWAGVDPINGDMLWYKNTPIKDANGKVVGTDRTPTNDPNQVTRTFIDKTDPELIGGVRNYFAWKGIELNFLFTFSLGGKIWDDGWLYGKSDGYNSKWAISTDQLARWQNTGDVTNVPQRRYNNPYGNYTSSRGLYDNNYLRLKTLSLAYNLPESVLKYVGLNSVRLNVSGTNLLTWKSDHAFDPETGPSGVSGFAFPSVKTYVFGIEIGF